MKFIGRHAFDNLYYIFILSDLVQREEKNGLKEIMHSHYIT